MSETGDKDGNTARTIDIRKGGFVRYDPVGEIPPGESLAQYIAMGQALVQNALLGSDSGFFSVVENPPVDLDCSEEEVRYSFFTGAADALARSVLGYDIGEEIPEVDKELYQEAQRKEYITLEELYEARKTLPNISYTHAKTPEKKGEAFQLASVIEHAINIKERKGRDDYIEIQAMEFSLQHLGLPTGRTFHDPAFNRTAIEREIMHINDGISIRRASHGRMLNTQNLGLGPHPKIWRAK